MNGLATTRYLSGSLRPHVMTHSRQALARVLELIGTSLAWGDFNGDGITDVLWRNDNENLVEWLGQASGGWLSNAANASGALSNSWHIQDPFF